MNASLAAVTALLLLAGVQTAHAQQDVASTRCAACHGAGLADIPDLAGQKRGYLLRQLRAYVDGTRPDPSMRAAVSGLDDATLEQVAAHYAGLPARPLRPPAADAPGRNEAAVCTPCHGAFGVSGNDAWPSLAGQRADYLRIQLQAFANGTRRDAAMTRVAGALKADDIERLARYFENLAP